MDIRGALEKNKGIIIVVAVVILIVLVIFFASRTSKKETGTKESFVSPISTESSLVKTFGSIYFSSTADEIESILLPVYTAKPFSFSEIQNIVSNLGMGKVVPEVSSDGSSYFWGRGDDFIRYDLITGTFVLVTDPILLETNTLGVDFNYGNVERYFVAFVQKYLDAEVDVSAKMEKTGTGYRVRGSWLLNTYPVVEKFGQTYSVMATFDDEGRLLTLYASMMKFNRMNSKIEIMSTRDLRSYLNYNNFPKEAYVAIIPDEYSCEEDCDPYTLDEVKSFQQAEIKTMEIVYFYSSSTNDVLPVYKLTGEGISYSSGLTHPVTVTIYANAIDPAQIIIPAEE